MAYSTLFNKHVGRKSYRMLQCAAVADALGEAMHEGVRRRPYLYPFCIAYLGVSSLPTSFGLWSAMTVGIGAAVKWHPGFQPLRQRLDEAKSGDTPITQYADYLYEDPKHPGLQRVNTLSLSRHMHKVASCQAWLATWYAWGSCQKALASPRQKAGQVFEASLTKG